MYFKFLFVVVVCGLIVLLEQPVKLSAQQTTSKAIDIDLSLSSSELNPDLIAPTENYSNAVVLIEPDVYLLYWRSKGTHIQFEIHAKTSGWFSFGVKSKSTSQIDFVVGYLNDDGTGHFSDRYGASIENSRVDSRQDWLPIYMSKNNGYTIFSFVRSLRVCAGRSDEDVEDVDIPLSGNATVVFSTGEVFNGEFVPYEILKGQKEIELVSIDPDEDDLPPLVNCTGGGEDQESKFNPKPLVNLANKLELVKNRLVLFWNLTKNAIIAEVHLNAKGWFSLGISSNKETIKSDLLVAWIADEKAYFFDCHVNNSQVIIDKNSSYELLYATETNTNVTIFRFRREAILCDLDDKTIETGTPFLKFNWGLDKPKSLENINKLVKQPQNSGLVQIDFFSKSYLINKEQKLDYLDFTISHVVMPYDTGFFYCKAFEIPRSLAKRHFVKWEIKLPRVNLDKIRNIRLYKCHSSYRGEPSIGSGDCYANTHKLESCYEPLIIWSHGSNTVTLFPEDAGYPIGQDAGYSYVVLEILYQNIDPQPKQEDDDYDDEVGESSSTPKLAYFDQLTLRLFMAEKLRANELGVITLGTEPEPIGILIPPQFQRFQISSFCFNNCIKEKFATVNEVTVVMAFPNTNRAGREVSTSIVRNNKEVEYIHRNRHYNSNYQNYVELNPRVNITKDDTLITKCFYSTIDRSSLTVGGYVANKEMCLEHFFYYPPIKNFGYCGSFPTFDDQLNMFNELKKKGLINYNDASTRSTNNGGILMNSQANNDKLATLYSAYDNLAKMSTFDPTISARLVELYNSSRFYSSCEDGNLFKAQTKPDVEKWLSEAEKSHIIPQECMTRRNASHIQNDGTIEEDASKNNLMSLGVNANLPSASVRISHWSSNILYFFSIIVTTLLVRSF